LDPRFVVPRRRGILVEGHFVVVRSLARSLDRLLALWLGSDEDGKKMDPRQETTKLRYSELSMKSLVLLQYLKS